MMAKKTSQTTAKKNKNVRQSKTQTKKKSNKKWIQDAEIKKGTFTRKAQEKGITSAQLQENVLSNPDDYDEKTVKQARLRKTLVGLKKRRDDQPKQEKKDA